MFLIQSLLQTAPDRDKIAVILLNVKHGDLLHIDEPGDTSMQRHAKCGK
ncbi:MAG: hypothetical protein KatS3mg018_1574 [Fimbriimonadales bacterium]|nr:MAG: hypothetical protein KatS3mg018_1574 [Fimbriimonadales bacterium]